MQENYRTFHVVVVYHVTIVANGNGLVLAAFNLIAIVIRIFLEDLMLLCDKGKIFVFSSMRLLKLKVDILNMPFISSQVTIVLTYFFRSIQEMCV